jgi:hypothetical protein
MKVMAEKKDMFILATPGITMVLASMLHLPKRPATPGITTLLASTEKRRRTQKTRLVILGISTETKLPMMPKARMRKARMGVRMSVVRPKVRMLARMVMITRTAIHVVTMTMERREERAQLLDKSGGERLGYAVYAGCATVLLMGI